MENLAIYSHYVDTERIIKVVEGLFDIEEVEIERDNSGQWTSITIANENGLKMNCRQRIKPDFELYYTDEPITRNLIGMYNFTNQLPSRNDDVKQRLLVKITTTNTEIGIMAQSFADRYKDLVLAIAAEMDAFIFSGNNSMFSTDSANGFWDKHGKLLLDMTGRCEAESLDVIIENKYYHKD
jgi:hypothetical protein